jgi:hypothetical protein
MKMISSRPAIGGGEAGLYRYNHILVVSFCNKHNKREMIRRSGKP